MNRYFAWFGLPGSLVLTVLMSIYALVLAFIDPTLSRLSCVVAMFLCSLGDILLMDYEPITRHFPKRGFIPGAITFAVAHLVYACAFMWLITEDKHPYFNLGAYAGIAIFVGLGIWVTVTCYLRNADKKMLPLCLLYLFFISVNCTTVLSAAVSCGGIRWISAVGVISFVISDLFISFDRICNIELKNSRMLIWTFYPIGQILLLIGA